MKITPMLLLGHKRPKELVHAQNARKKGNQRPRHIITRSPNQYPNYKTSTDIKPIYKDKGSIVIFDDMLGT